MPSRISKTVFKTVNYFRKSHADAVIPTQEKGDVGWDLYSVAEVSLDPGKVTNINTGLQIARTPFIDGNNSNMWSVLMKIEGRSGLASKGVFPVGGIIDPNYRGDIGVCLFNSSNEHHRVEPGDRVAQLVLYPVVALKDSHHVEFQEVEWQDGSNRGNKGFGSSGR